MRAAYAHFRQHLMVLSHYRVELVVWNLLGALQLVVYLAVWTAVANASGGSIGGYDAQTLAAYYTVMLLYRRLQVPAIIWKMSGEVRRGDFTVRLLRPYHPAMAIHASEIGATMLSMINVFLFSIPIAIGFHASFDAQPSTMLAAVALTPFAIIVRYLLDSLVATLTFRYTRIEGFRAVYLLALTFLGGQFVPISLVPDWFAAIARALPFYWILGFPVQLFIGYATLSEAFTGFLVLAAWAIALYLLFRVVWARGLRRLETVGS